MRTVVVMSAALVNQPADPDGPVPGTRTVGLRALTAGAGVCYESAARMPRNSDIDDVELVRRLVAGRTDAMATLYDRYAELLLAVGLRVLQRRTEAEDLVHDVFVEAWRQAAQYDPARGSVRAWLVTRMRSRCLDRQKSAAVSRSVPLDRAPERATAASAGSAGDGDRVQAALQALPAEQRQVLELAYFDGLSCTEIAARMEVPVGTVKSRSAAAMGKLRQALGEGR